MENIKEKQRFGKLTVLSFVEKRNYRNFWLCECECGTERIIRETTCLKEEQLHVVVAETNLLLQDFLLKERDSGNSQ